MTKRAGIERFFPAALLVLLALSILNLFGDHRFGGGVPIFFLGCAATGFLFLIGNSMKMTIDAEDNVDEMTPQIDAETEYEETDADRYVSNMSEEHDDFLPDAMTDNSNR